KAAGLAKRVLAGRRIGRVAAGVRDPCDVAERPYVLVPPDAEQVVDLDAPLLVEWQLPLTQQRVRRDASRPDERARRDLLPISERHLVGRDRGERRVDVDLDPALS